MRGMREISRWDALRAAFVAAAVALSAICADTEGRYESYEDAPGNHIELCGDTLILVSEGGALMPDMRFMFRMEAESDTVIRLKRIKPDSIRRGIVVESAEVDALDGGALMRRSDYELVLEPGYFPYVDTRWLGDRLSVAGIAIVCDGEIISTHSDLERLQAAVKDGYMTLRRLSSREAYRLLGAVGIRGALVFTHE